MGVGAILVVNDRTSCAGSSAELYPAKANAAKGPITCIDILGESVLDRTITRLRKAGIESITVIAGRTWSRRPYYRGVRIISTANRFTRWPAAQQALRDQKNQGTDTVLMIGLNAYMEVNLEEALEFHHAKGTPLTQVEDENGSLDFWIVDTDWFCTAATGCTLPFRYGEFPGLPVSWRTTGYVNRLTGAGDVRQLVCDALLSRCEFKPRGTEVSPGIWVDEGARIHRHARLNAPVYIGRFVKVGQSAIVTGFSNVERHCRIGTATTVKTASILSHTILGDGLDISNSVVNGSRYVDLKRNIALDIEDSRLVADAAPAMWRSPARWEYVPARRENNLVFDYSQYLTRAAGRLSEVLFRG